MVHLCLKNFTNIRRHFIPNNSIIGNSVRYLSTMETVIKSGRPKPLVAVGQMTCTEDKSKNLQVGTAFIKEASEKGAQMVFLPEAVDYIATSRQQSIELAETLEGPVISQYKTLAKAYDIWVSLGGVHIKPKETADDQRLSITHVIINNGGEIVQTYQKAHLFDISIPGKVNLKESDYTKPGGAITAPIKTPLGNVGMSICYDLRFPEVSLTLRHQGAHILTFPSAFTVETGKAHWEVLLRSRAIENQCYVIASAQVGQHNKKRSSYGHSMIIDPWGRIVAHNPDQVDLIMAEVNLDLLNEHRVNMPVEKHRRHDLYGHVNVTNQDLSYIDSTPFYNFATHSISSSCVFYKSALSFCFMSNKPVLTGHTLVCPLRVVARLSDLTSAEVCDLFLTVQTVSRMIEKYYGATSLTVSIQDGPQAGQTFPHVHVHILPRKKGDFTNNDDIYDKLEHHDLTDRRALSEEELMEQAAALRKLMTGDKTA